MTRRRRMRPAFGRKWPSWNESCSTRKAGSSTFRKFCRKKKRQIRQAGTGKSRELAALDRRKAELEASAKELSEALREGESVLVNLNNAHRLLQSAKSWGTYDLMGGGSEGGKLKIVQKQTKNVSIAKRTASV